MAHSRRNIVNHLQQRCLRQIYNNKSSFYDELLLNIGSASIHHRNIQNIAIEMFEVKSHLLPEIVAAYFWSKHKLIIMTSQWWHQIMTSQTHHKSYNDFRTPAIRSAYQGSKNISILGHKVWNSRPSNLKQNLWTVLKSKFKPGNQKVAPFDFARLI